MRKAIPFVILLTLVWGTNWPLFPIVTREVSVWTFRALSLSIAGVGLLLIARMRGVPLGISREHWGTLVWAVGTYLVVWNVASTYAAMMIPSGQAAILGFTMPLWAAVLAWLVLSEKPTPRVFVALAVGGFGILLLMWNGIHAYAEAPLGFACGLLAGFGWAVGTLILKRRPIPGSPLVTTGWQLLVAAVPMTIGAFAFAKGSFFVPSTTTIAIILYIAVVPMALGNATWFSIVGMLPANVAGLSSVMVPVVAMISGAIVLNEPLGLVQWISILCCAASVGLALRR